MPAVIPPEHWATWLGEEPASAEDLKAILVPYAGELDMRQQMRAEKPPRPSTQTDLFAGL